MAKNKRQDIDQAFSIITGGGSAAAAKPKKITPLGVKLEPDEVAALDQAAQQLGVNRHQLLQYAVRVFLARYAKGERPEFEVKTTKTLKVE